MRPELLAALALAAAPSQALEIVFNDTGVAQGYTALSPQALAGFEAAASLWEALLADPVTVRIDVATYNFGAGSSNIIGQASSEIYDGSYTELRDAWIGDASSLTDNAVLNSLSPGPSYTRRINRTSDLTNPAIPVLAATDGMYINGANAKALGLLPGDFNAVDAAITFNSAYAFDYDRSNGISAGQMDFIGVAAHEIGHALGFISVVDYIDGGGIPTNFAWHMPMDFLRYSEASLALGVTDTSIDDQIRFLALGNLGILVSTGVKFGDGQQASHFLDNVGLGMMDPTADNGELRLFTGYDLVIFDALGWDLTPEALNLASAAMAAIPEPSTYGLAMGALGLAWAVRHRRKVS
jgi:hypothetical protein